MSERGMRDAMGSAGFRAPQVRDRPAKGTPWWAWALLVAACILFLQGVVLTVLLCRYNAFWGELENEWRANKAKKEYVR